jgi:hypothetical protein
LANRSFRDYFALYGPTPVMGGGGTGNRSQVYLFFGVLLGALCKVIYDALQPEGALYIKTIIIAVIVSVVIFPQLYYSGGLDKRKLSFAHWTLAFQNGFFWTVAFAELSKKLAP